MGAGSKRASRQEQMEFYDLMHPDHIEKLCDHDLVMRTDIGICHFENTGQRYRIDRCRSCQKEYLILL